MDGNGRWAAQRGLMRVEGHQQGVLVVKEVIKAAIQHDIPNLSLFVFSHENWHRPEDEINFLMTLFVQSLHQELPELIQQGIRLRFLGASERLSKALKTEMELAEEQTAQNSRLNLNIALNYTGKWDILQAVKAALGAGITLENLSENDISRYLSTPSDANPDLFIRTSGEQRISNFFLWQLAYTELYFTDILWPDFNALEFEKALAFYQSRERRFGKISAQIQGEL
jgi:undecaprenyl diphosphate synthase